MRLSPRAAASALALAMLLMNGGGATPLALGAGSKSAQVDAALQRLTTQRPADQVRIMVQARHASDAEDAVRHSAGRTIAHLPHVAGISAEVRADQVLTIAHQPGIVRVLFDPAMHAVDRVDAVDGGGPQPVFAQTVGAPALWAAGDTGRGMSVAVLDSGVQPHNDFGTPSRIVHAERFNTGASSVADQYGHGTWVAGIAAGDGAASGARYIGVAPRSSIVNLKVSDDTGAAHASDVIQALGWVAANHAAFNIRVVNLSFVSSLAEGYATSLLDAAVEMVWHAGVVVVVSAGNSGPDGEHFAPANDPYVITVGASDDMGTVSPKDDVLAWFSSYGTTQDGYQKPDVLAPGRHIVGPLASSGSMVAREFPSKVIGQRYIQLSGTSAAAAVVSGAVALLLQVGPQLTPDQVKWLVVHTAMPLYSSVGAGSGELDIASSARNAGRAGSANVGLTPNRLVALAYLSSQTSQSGVSWDSVSWDSVSWDSVSWDSVSWDSVSWDSVLGDD